ncbi:carbohydrate ABC transporter permease [Streptomyces sp. NPDC101393]|uniref:carbohydrate ABC transporter permease n=1 Tax=Streptomyces sp. NPDC101393 TaxID=3366141 RepID=UPI0037F88D33
MSAPNWRKGLLCAGVAAVVVHCLAPFCWMLVSSLRRTSGIFDVSPLPSPLSFENYPAVFDPSPGVGRALLNRLIVAGVTTVLALVLATFTACAMARLHFRFERVVLTLIITTSMFPVVSIVVPLLKVFTDIGWLHTYQAMIVPSLSFALPLARWNPITFFRQLPRELEQTAMADGCTRGAAFRNPLRQPDGRGVLVTLPLVIVVPIFQRRIVAGLPADAAK